LAMTAACIAGHMCIVASSCSAPCYVCCWDWPSTLRFVTGLAMGYCCWVLHVCYAVQCMHCCWFTRSTHCCA
jgi:hypothetical protein